METEITLQITARIAWRLEEGKPVIDGVEIVGQPVLDSAELRRALAASLTDEGPEQ